MTSDPELIKTRKAQKVKTPSKRTQFQNQQNIINKIFNQVGTAASNGRN